MKLIRFSLAALLALAVAAAVPAFAQHDGDGDSRHDRGKDKDKDRGKGKDKDFRHDRGRAVGHERRDGDEYRERHEGREWHEDRGRGHEREWDHERYAEYVRYHHRYIPEDHFRAHFGHEHRFVIVRPVIVAGHPRFRYGGYWFVIGRPLPPGWGYSDEVYVDYIDDG